ncbi:hypothetical protein [Bradyrhizobium sp. STM 3843]|uniref:hypothetical protein n=1 Tax=Bradyrhizobium sp. STM 3843 TaxID=551947 RepID=UPI001FCC3E50|nr:hypothetical protein [Bradyrhizobium sp. STM 3843]
MADRFQTDRNAIVHERMVFREKDIKHGLADQLRHGIAKLSGTESVHIQHSAARIDHEIHDRIVLENLPPFPFAVAQFTLAASEICLGLKRHLLFLAGISDQPRHHHPGYAEGGHRDDMLRKVDCDA